MPAGWVAAATAVVGAGASMYSAKKQGEAAEDAAKREGAASTAAIERQEAAYEEAKAALSPYARQEQAASSQMMTQLGLGGGGGGAPGGADPWGFEAGGYGAGASDQADRDAAEAAFLDNLIAEEMAIARRAGYKGKHGYKAVAQGARMATSAIKQLKAAGKLPPDFKEPSMADWDARGWEQMKVHGGYKALGRNFGDLSQSSGFGRYEQFASTYMDETTRLDDAAAERAAAAEDATMGGGVGGAPGATGPGGAFTAGDIMGMAGVEQLPQEIQDQYLADLMEDPRSDPELAAYLGLTEESMQVGAGYQDTPAYAAAREAGVEAVDAGAAAGGGLYSGRRGRALRDVGQEVEQQYYQDAMNRRQQMMGARRGERAAAIGRRGVEYGAERGREQSYYNNYMQMLSAMASPQVTQNIAAMGTSLGKETSANLMGTARSIGDLEIGAAGAEGAAIADIAGGAMDMASTWIENRDQGG